MKRIIALTFLFFTFYAFAADPVKFINIELSGSEEEFYESLKKKGYVECDFPDMLFINTMDQEGYYTKQQMVSPVKFSALKIIPKCFKGKFSLFPDAETYIIPVILPKERTPFGVIVMSQRGVYISEQEYSKKCQSIDTLYTEKYGLPVSRSKWRDRNGDLYDYFDANHANDLFRQYIGGDRYVLACWQKNNTEIRFIHFNQRLFLSYYDIEKQSILDSEVLEFIEEQVRKIEEEKNAEAERIRLEKQQAEVKRQAELQKQATDI